MLSLTRKLVNHKKGFTLIELLVVIAIISIMVVISSMSYQRTIKLSRDNKRKTDLEQIRQALESYRSETYVYPTTAEGIAILATNGYISKIPSDPIQTKSYYYERTGSETSYILCAALDIDPSLIISTCNTRSCGDTTCNYQTTQP